MSSSLECNWQKRCLKNKENLWHKLHRLLFLLHLVHLVVNFDCSPQPLKSCKYERVIVNNNQFSHFQRKAKQEQVLKTFLSAMFIVFVEEKVLGRLWAKGQSCDLEDCRHCRDRQQPGPAMEVTVIAKNNIVKLVKYCRILCSLTNRQGCRADCPCREPANNSLSNCLLSTRVNFTSSNIMNIIIIFINTRAIKSPARGEWTL